MEAPDNLEVAKMVSEAVRAAVAVQSDAFSQALADDAVATAEEKAAHAYGSGMDDCNSAGGGAVNAPWQFDSENGWRNRWVQVGYKVTTCPQGDTDDGKYYVKVNLRTEELELVIENSYPDPDIANDTVYLYVGQVEDGVQKESICSMPVAYKDI